MVCFLQQTFKKALDSVEHNFIFSVFKNLVLCLILYSGLKLCSVMHRAVL